MQGRAKTPIFDLLRLLGAHRGARRGVATLVGPKLIAAAAFASASFLGIEAASSAPLPPPEVARLLEAPPPPNISEDPQRRYLLLVQQRDLLPASSLAEPMLSVVGVKINPRNYGRHAPIAYYGLTLVDLATSEKRELQVPSDATIGYPIWSADGSRFAFSVAFEDGIELWVGEPAEGRVRKLVGPTLNATLSAPCTWMPDNRRLLCRLIGGKKRTTPTAYTADALSQLTEPTMMRSVWQEQVVDQWAIQQYIESQLTLVDAETGHQQPVGPRAAVESVDPAPSGAFLLVSRIMPPYAQVAGVNEAQKTVEVWDRFGNILQTFLQTPGDPNLRRAVNWHPSMPATLVWVQRNAEGGDRIMTHAPPYIDAPKEIFRSENRYAGLDWLEGAGNMALVSEYDTAHRMKRIWLVDADRTAAGELQLPRLLGESSIDAAFAEFGSPVHKSNRWGKQVVAVYDNGIYLRGDTAAANGATAHLDYMKLDSLATNRLWQSDGKANEAVVSLLTRDGDALLTRHETSREPPNYFVRGKHNTFTQRVTNFSHPAAGLQDAHRVPLRYDRPDGYELSANLYLPAQHDSLEPLPVIIWAYPRVYGSDTRSMTSSAAESFPDFERAFKLFFLLQGYAVLDDVSMPIIGDGGDANDTFVQQIVTNANAVIEAAAATGYIDAERVGVAGHSYGAFMVANLLAHSDLFEAGVALSGAYNRTLTPFGFQTERRSLWEARETYLAMSPFMHSNSIHEPLLLVHGLLDENAGTPPIQSIQFYEAIKHNGGNADILLLPREGHSYRGRESVLATAAAMLDFFDANLKRRDEKPMSEVLRTASFAPAEQVGAKLAR